MLAIKNTSGESSGQGIGKMGESSDGRNEIENKPKGREISPSIDNTTKDQVMEHHYN